MDNEERYNRINSIAEEMISEGISLLFIQSVSFLAMQNDGEGYVDLMELWWEATDQAERDDIISDLYDHIEDYEKERWSSYKENDVEDFISNPVEDYLFSLKSECHKDVRLHVFKLENNLLQVRVVKPPHVTVSAARYIAREAIENLTPKDIRGYDKFDWKNPDIRVVRWS